MNPALVKFVRSLVGMMPKKVALAMVLLVTVSLTDGLGLVLLVPILREIGLQTQSGTVTRLGQAIGSGLAMVGARPTLLVWLVVYGLAMSSFALLVRLQTVVAFRIQNDLMTGLRNRLFQAMANATWTFFVRSRSMNFTHALTAEVTRVGVATQSLLQLASAVVITAVYLLVALQLSAAMTAVMLACGLGLILLVHSRLRVSRLAGEGLTRAMSSLYSTIGEHLGALKLAKSYNAQQRAAQLFMNTTNEVAELLLRAVRSQAAVKFWFDVGSVLILCASLYLAVTLMGIPTGGLILLLFVFARTIPRMSVAVQSYQQVANGLPAFLRIVELERDCLMSAEAPPDRSLDLPFREAIRLERVVVVREPGARSALADLDLLIAAGRTTAIVGLSGAGKTTVADLVIGLITPSSGRVLVDGLPLSSERMFAWRSRIAYVQQDSFLFHDSVRANLLWAAPEASERDIWHALQLAAADEFVASFPHGLDTTVGDRGVRLSGGERQRLALAQALIRKPSLLILDEATSNLDAENEGRIRHAIESLHGRVTILLISHRLSIVQGADVIYVLDEGRLIESGSWDTLMGKKDGRLFKLWGTQAAAKANGSPEQQDGSVATDGLVPPNASVGWPAPYSYRE